MNTKFNKLYIMIGSTILLFIAMILLFVLFYNANKTMNEFHVDDSELYTYFGRQKITYNSHITLTRNNYATEVKIDGDNSTLGTEPLYFKDNKKILIPNDMSIVSPLENMKQRKLNHYSIIESKERGSYLIKDGSNKEVSDLFLYDGNDLYVFLKETNITFGDKNITISPMSFCLCVYNDELYIYNYVEDKLYYYDLKEESDVNVFASNDSYTLNINFDYIKFNNKSILLNKKINSLDVFN